MDIRTYLKDHVLLFDGAMGTYYAAGHPHGEECCERANISAPADILEIHRAYLAAGCKAIKTNTFAVNRPALGEADCVCLLEAGYGLAREAAGASAFVFADIGPISVPDSENLFAEYQFVVDRFLELGADHFLFETHSQDTCLHRIAAYLKKQRPEVFILVSFAAQPDGFTRAGVSAAALIHRAEADENIDAVGLNCISGAKHMAALVEALGPIPKPLSAMPNAGYPTVLGSRTFYHGDPAYFALQLSELAARGARILGGCCGTTPAHIAALAQALGSAGSKPVVLTDPPKRTAAPPKENPFYTALCDPDRKPFAVELDPPEAADITKFMAGARELRAGGADVITIADCPIARARMDAGILACKLRRELSMEALPHMTCRDRNLNATKALLLGLSAEEIHNVLVATGDPIPSASRDEVKSVYNFNSRMLAGYINSLNETVLPTPFRVFGALNLNAVNFQVQLQLAQEKEAQGMCGFLTQPVLTARALENLKLARNTLKGKILGGIIPVVSHKNALFMNSEVAGIAVAPEIIDRYAGLDRQQGEALAIKISRTVAGKIAPYVDGFYLMTPFGRTNLMVRIMDAIRKDLSL